MRRWKRWWRQTRTSRDGIAEAEQALQREKDAREKVECKRPEVDELTRSLAQHRSRNHFGELIRRSLS